MFVVVEFEKSAGGGLAIVRDEWMTPRKKECFWPPFKQTVLYNKCLTSKTPENPDEKWSLCPVERVFYITDDIQKAREKLRRAESESEVLTELDELGKTKRRRKPSKKLFVSDSSSDDGESPARFKKLPRPPQNPGPSKTQNDVNDVANVSNGSLLDGNSTDSHLAHTCSPTSEERNLSSAAEFNLARIISRIEKRLDDIQQTQNEILEEIIPTTKATNVELPEFLILPCSCPEQVTVLEEWLESNEEHTDILVKKLSLLGGRKVSHVVRNLLQTIFTNKVAVFYNWTGKYNKKPLKDLVIVKLIPGIVRKNRHTQQASDAEIREVISAWFRFARDRDGGRDIRRKQGSGRGSSSQDTG